MKTNLLAVLLLPCFGSINAQNALTSDGASIYLESAALIHVQGNLENKSTGSFTNNGIVSLTGNLIHNASVNLNSISAGTFRLTGSTNQLISGSRQPDFFNLTLDKSAGECQLQTGFSLSHHLTFTSGDLFLNNQQVDLLTSGLLMNEASTRRAYDNPTGTGTLKIVQALNAPSLVNPGNLGATISSGQNMGITTITRGHTQQFIVSSNSITRYYDISPAMNTSLNATLRFSYFDNELNGQPENELVQWHSTSNSAIWLKKGGTLNMASDYSDLGGIDSFRRVSLISNKIIPLPLTWLSFTATKTASAKVLLQWKTAEEINCSHFEIERSVDGGSWIKIGTTLATGQPGLIQSYQLLDQSPVYGPNYYRIKQMDLDGRYEYTPVRLINFTDNGPILIYPTLTRSNSSLFIEGASLENSVVELFDNNGRLILRTKLHSNSIGLPSLATGTYHVKVANNAAKTITTQQIVIY
ncbi:MAG TPA: T9SS type A sorting domain-containing protein [Chitinophagaceae bacterium]